MTVFPITTIDPTLFSKTVGDETVCQHRNKSPNTPQKPFRTLYFSPKMKDSQPNNIEQEQTRTEPEIPPPEGKWR